MTVVLIACETSTLKSPLLRAFFTPHVHSRLRKRLSRCTLDCGFKTSESPALRGFVAERGPVRGTSLYLYQNRTASTVQKSGLKSSVFRPKAFPQISPRSYRHNAVPNRFSTSLTNGPRPLSQVKAGTRSAFGEGSHTAAYTPKQGAFRMGVVSLPSERSARSQTSPGRVSERRTLPLLGLDRICSRRTQRAFGTATRISASLSRGVAAPLGCVIFSVSVEIAACTPCAQGLSVCARRGVVLLLPACSACCRNAGWPLVKRVQLPFSEAG